MGDRKALSSTVKIKYKHTSKVVPIIVNRLYSFSKHCTWNEVLNDLTADGDHNIDKLDEVTVTVSDKLANGVTFEPDFEEQIQVVHNFDKKLKYVQFDVIRDLEPNNNVPKGQNPPTCPTAFDVLMRKSSTLTKLPQKIDEASPRFTGDVLHGKVFTRLQLACTSHIEFAYYSSDVGRKDICAYCVATEIQKDKDLCKNFKVVLPVCDLCRSKKLEVPKRNPIKK
ncbi:uncharacterized protein LOC125665239 [Ostrea edulis]|uniref:uncharacterized protein LOC125665239 n=1 Tax=Ostrea edulis TaxID=37623 RepID=UPI0024AF3BCC|nr:uncharacterized protein LOC125665239 [Ostrea edulis]